MNLERIKIAIDLIKLNELKLPLEDLKISKEEEQTIYELRHQIKDLEIHKVRQIHNLSEREKEIESKEKGMINEQLALIKGKQDLEQLKMFYDSEMGKINQMQKELIDYKKAIIKNKKLNVILEK